MLLALALAALPQTPSSSTYPAAGEITAVNPVLAAALGPVAVGDGARAGLELSSGPFPLPPPAVGNTYGITSLSQFVFGDTFLYRPPSAPGTPLTIEDDLATGADIIRFESPVTDGTTTWTCRFEIIDASGNAFGTPSLGHIEFPFVVADEPDRSGTLELLDATGNQVVVASIEAFRHTSLGGVICFNAPNSRGYPALIYAQGSALLAENRLTITCSQLPTGSASVLLVSDGIAFTPFAGGSVGNLCLGGSIGRFVGPGEVQVAGPSGYVDFPTDLLALPGPNGPTSASVGSVLYFQAWYRDVQGGAPVSNFSWARSVTVQ
ncbi:MAG: hypothetical protein AAF726_00565 [Planctomycetota bacterium]